MGALKDGRKVVAAAATRERLSTVSTPCNGGAITAEQDNTGVVVVGGATVVAAIATRQGTPLWPGDTFEFDVTDEIDDLMEIWLDATVSGEGVTYTYGDPT